MTGPLFDVTEREEGVVSVRVATDDEPYLAPAWVDGLAAALVRVAGETRVRAVVLEGGERYFCAGASRTALSEASGPDALRYAGRAAHALLDLPLPVIAAAAGHAIGGGLLLALWCDTVVLAEDALYGANFMALGFTPGMGATHAMQEAFGAPLARELLFSGRLLTGREIRDACCPLSRAVRPRGEVLDRALSLAGQFAEAPRDAIVLLKQNLAARRRDALGRALHAEESDQARLFVNPATRREIARRYPTGVPRRSDS